MSTEREAELIEALQHAQGAMRRVLAGYDRLLEGLGEVAKQPTRRGRLRLAGRVLGEAREIVSPKP